MKRKNVCDLCRGTAFQTSRTSEIQRRVDVSQSVGIGRMVGGGQHQGKERTKFQRNMSCPRDSKTSLLWEKASLKIMGVLQSSVERQWGIEQGINDLWTRLILRLCTRLMTFSTSFQITSLQLLKFGQGTEDWPVIVSPSRALTVHLARKDRRLHFPFPNDQVCLGYSWPTECKFCLCLLESFIYLISTSIKLKSSCRSELKDSWKKVRLLAKQ